MSTNKRDQNPASEEVVKEPPQIIMTRLNNAPLLPNESRKEVWEIFKCFERDVEPETMQDYFTLAEVTLLMFEAMRYRKMSAAIVKNQERAAVQTLFRSMNKYGIQNKMAASLAANDTVQWFADEAFRKQASSAFERGGFTPDAISIEAYNGALPSVSALDKLVASAWKRMDKFLNDLGMRQNHRAAVLRMTVERKLAEASNDTANS
jgi:hypothetical protein